MNVGETVDGLMGQGGFRQITNGLHEKVLFENQLFLGSLSGHSLQPSWAMDTPSRSGRVATEPQLKITK